MLLLPVNFLCQYSILLHVVSITFAVIWDPENCLFPTQVPRRLALAPHIQAVIVVIRNKCHVCHYHNNTNILNHIFCEWNIPCIRMTDVHIGINILPTFNTQLGNMVMFWICMNNTNTILVSVERSWLWIFE